MHTLLANICLHVHQSNQTNIFLFFLYNLSFLFAPIALFDFESNEGGVNRICFPSASHQPFLIKSFLFANKLNIPHNDT